MEKYQIKKAGIGMKIAPSKLKGRVFEHKVFGLSYIAEIKDYAKDKFLGYPAMLLTPLYGDVASHIAYVEEDIETWNGEVTTLSGEKVSRVEAGIYL